jgi:hypothetical protein
MHEVFFYFRTSLGLSAYGIKCLHSVYTHHAQSFTRCRFSKSKADCRPTFGRVKRGIYVRGDRCIMSIKEYFCEYFGGPSLRPSCTSTLLKSTLDDL